MCSSPSSAGASDTCSTRSVVLPADLPATWRAQAETLRRFGAEAQAKVCEELADELEAAAREYMDEPLELADAACESGYSTSQLRRLFPGMTEIPRRCLPRKPKPIASARPRSLSSPAQIAREILDRG